MKRIELLKDILGDEYIFAELLPLEEIKRILEQNNQDYCDEVVYVLNAGCVGIEMTLFLSGQKIIAGYDCLIRDWKLQGEWTSYDEIPVVVNLDADDMEEEIFNVLNRYVEQEGLSYTELNHEKVT